MTLRKDRNPRLGTAVPAPAGGTPPGYDGDSRPGPRDGKDAAPTPPGDADLRDLEREAAMVALFDAHHTQLVRLALLLGAEHDAEDLVSEAFCELHRRWRRLRSAAAAPAYLRSIVCNLARMRIRHLQVERRHAHQQAGSFGVRTAESAEHSVVLHEDQQRVITALQSLPTRQREALVLRYWLDLKEADIADSMGISLGAVKSHIFRGMSALSTRIEGGDAR